jgi:GDP-D-mannose dehydratase
MIAGVTVQDGSQLIHHLLSLDNRIMKTSDDTQMANLSRQERIEIWEILRWLHWHPTPFAAS